jgi:hypothetical protein
MKGVFLFYTNSAAFQAERALKRARLSVKLIPTPRQFSSDCGISLQFDWNEGERARALLAETGVEHAGRGMPHPSSTWKRSRKRVRTSSTGRPSARMRARLATARQMSQPAEVRR